MPRDVSGRATALALILTMAVGCQGSIDGGGRGSGDGNGNGGGGQGMDRPDRPGDRSMPPPAGASAAVAPLRRLTAAQYRNTVRDLLGFEDPVPASALPADEVIADRFFSNVLTPLKSIDLDKYAAAAQALAARALMNLGALVPCDPAAGDAACAQKFIESFGKRAYRRPLTAVEIDRLKAVYTGGGDFRTGIGQVIEALLQSPKFLYLYEPVPRTAGQVVGVDRWAMASRLSYLFLGSMPDDALFAAAEAGELSTAEQVGKQAARLMTDRRFRDTLSGFHQGWLQLGELAGAEKDAMVFPAWNPALKAALAEESRRFIEHVFTEADRRLDTLLSAPFSFLSGPLYAHYGVSAPAGAGADWQRVDLPKDQRAGILTEAGLLASLAHENRTSYILRGKMIREALFCTKVPDPPGNVPPEMNVSPTANARERAAQHRADPNCATCHALFDPIGFAFETYDAIGRYRARDGGGAIDTRIELTATQTLDGPVTGAVDLATKLASAAEVRDCVARQWMRYALGRNDAAEDEPSMKAVSQAFRDAGGKLPDLLLAVARSEALRFQKVAP